MEEYIVDLSGVTDRDSLHECLKKTLPLPPWYGSNLDALYDALTDMTDPVCIRFTGWKHLIDRMPSYFGSLRQVLNDAQVEAEGLFCFWEEDAPAAGPDDSSGSGGEQDEEDTDHHGPARML